MDGAEENCVKDLDLSTEEAVRLKKAFKDEKFLKLFQEYIEDVNSPKSQKSYEEEIISIEKERGFDVKFIHPDPVYVIKFTDSEGKIFINICKNQYVKEAISERKNSGTEWKIPVILSKPRQDVDKKKVKCKVIDVMFHPQTMDFAKQDSRFKGIVEDTALTTVKEQFGIDLSSKSKVHPKMKYKGKAPLIILRKSIQNKEQSYVCEPLEDYVKKILPKTKSDENSKCKLPKIKEPKYCVKYRDVLDLKDYSLMGYTDRAAPKEIIIEIQLPEVQKASDVELDILEKKLLLRSCPGTNHSYSLNLDLSYAVDMNAGIAKLDKTKKILKVALPVKDRGIPVNIGKNEKTDEKTQKIFN
ncbi:protein kintoun [Nephila pilipes]|uniref:Protein kintoun n=1 Tax=Nephila pilipes TaxID=299642 RepID=A0A8X6PVI4_NEPPI|nr:protein kintoun [Nephila pilipes]